MTKEILIADPDKAVQEDFKSSEVKVLRRWPAIHSQPWSL